MLSEKEFTAELEGIYSSSFRYRDHPFIKAVAKGEAPLPHIREWGKQMYILLNHTGRSNGYIYANCPDPDVRMWLANVVADEELTTQCGSDSHLNLHVKFCRAIGLKEEELRQERPTAAMKEGLEWLMDVRKNKPSAVALSTSVEGAAVGLWSLLADAFRTHYGLSDDDVEMWTVHAEGDVEHGQLSRKLLLGYATTEEKQKEILETVRAGVTNFSRMFDAAFRAHELPRVGEPGWATAA